MNSSCQSGNPSCQSGVCEGLCTGEAARQCYLRTLAERDKTKVNLLQKSRQDTASLVKFRSEACAAFSSWICNKDQQAADELQRLLNSWPCERASNGHTYTTAA